MKKMKVIKRVLIVAPVVLIIVLVVVYVFLNSIVRSAAREILPKVTGTPCEIENVSINLFAGNATVEGLIIGNPEGFHTDSAFDIPNITATFSLKSLFTDTVLIQEMVIENPLVTYELGIRGSNLGQIKRHAEQRSEDSEPGKRVEIDRFIMTGGRARVASKDLGLLQATVPLPDIEVLNIGKHERLDVYAAADILLSAVLSVTDNAVKASEFIAAELRSLGATLEGLGRGILDEGRGIIDEGRGLIDRIIGQPEEE